MAGSPAPLGSVIDPHTVRPAVTLAQLAALRRLHGSPHPIWPRNVLSKCRLIFAESAIVCIAHVYSQLMKWHWLAFCGPAQDDKHCHCHVARASLDYVLLAVVISTENTG